MDATPPELRGPPLPVLLARLGGALVVLLVVVAVLGITLRAPLERLAAAFVARFGLPGIFAAVLLLDAVPFTTHEPILLFGYSGGIGYWRVALCAGVASVLSGPLGWALGRAAGRHGGVARLLMRYRITPFLRRYGIWAVAVAAITPFPFAVTTWGSGAAGVRLIHVLIGSLLRIPKVLLYLSLIVLGWHVGA